MRTDALRLHSRVHALNGFSEHCFVKRDDELSCGISGTKLRKYASLVPFWRKNNIRHLVIIAGAHSNNLLAALQLARENKLAVTALILKPKGSLIKGNFCLSQWFLSENDIQWIDRSQWSRVHSIARAIAADNQEKSFVLEEGASVKEAMPGAMSLADDIARNEKELGHHFEHIFIDAGTGFAAAALAHRLLKLNHLSTVHVLLLADSEGVYFNKIRQWLSYVPHNLQSFIPTTAKSFGSINQSIKGEIKRVAKEEGILLDAVYSAKLFYQSRLKIQSEALHGYKLIIHSGGVLSLIGLDLNSLVN